MSKVPSHHKPDEDWCEMLASFSADELLSSGLISRDQWGYAKRIIRQQGYVQLISNFYPLGDLNSD